MDIALVNKNIDVRVTRNSSSTKPAGNYLSLAIALHIAVLLVLVNLNKIKESKDLKISNVYQEPSIKATLYQYSPPTNKVKKEHVNTLAVKTDDVTKDNLTKSESENRNKNDELKNKRLISASNTQSTNNAAVNKQRNLSNANPSQKTSPRFSKKMMSQLKDRYRAQMLDSLTQESYQDYHNKGKQMSQSITKYSPSADKLPELRLKDKQVDCQSAMTQGAAVVSELLGGRLKCNSTPNLRKFLQDRQSIKH
ncbi:hypothetical protein [Thalassotalea ganghwensis]